MFHSLQRYLFIIAPMQSSGYFIIAKRLFASFSWFSRFFCLTLQKIYKIMRHSLFILFACAIASQLLCPVHVQAQQILDEIKADPYRGGDVYTAYIAPTKALTPAPKGYEAFYLSHYGRHGSRYLLGYKQYTRPLETLRKAHEAGKLTARGEKLYEQFKVINADVSGRADELTKLGAEQHRQIAQRLWERFPSIFEGKARIDAKSSVIIRCILSMENELMTLKGDNPLLDISSDASEHDMYYISHEDRKIGRQRKPAGSEAEKVYNAFRDGKFDPTRVMNEIFSSEEYWKENVKDPWQLVENDIWSVAESMQGTELRKEMSLLDLFTTDELYGIWQKRNADWYLGYSASPLNGGTQIYKQRNLMKNIIQETDSCLALKTLSDGTPWHGATMRFGHDTVLLPTACFMDLNGSGTPYSDFNDLVKNHWYAYRIFMMGSNIQLVFYRSTASKGKKGEGDILVKALLNEEEATIPGLTPVSGPYYKWSDVKALWEKKLSEYK